MTRRTYDRPRWLTLGPLASPAGIHVIRIWFAQTLSNVCYRIQDVRWRAECEREREGVTMATRKAWLVANPVDFPFYERYDWLVKDTGRTFYPLRRYR